MCVCVCGGGGSVYCTAVSLLSVCVGAETEMYAVVACCIVPADCRRSVGVSHGGSDEVGVSRQRPAGKTPWLCADRTIDGRCSSRCLPTDQRPAWCLGLVVQGHASPWFPPPPNHTPSSSPPPPHPVLLPSLPSPLITYRGKCVGIRSFPPR